MPRRRAIEERTWAASSFSPSILARFENVKRESFQLGFLLEREPEAFHAAQQSPLAVAYLGQRPGKDLLVPMECGPIRELMDITTYYTHHMRILSALFYAESRKNTQKLRILSKVSRNAQT